MRKYLLTLTSCFLFVISLSAQVQQTDRYEMPKKNTDDFFTVASAGENGLVIIRDTNKEFSFSNKVDGDTWLVAALDTTLQERWKHDLSVDYKHHFKAFDLNNDKLYLLFREGEYEKNDYHIIIIDILSGDIEKYDVENEVGLDLSHITVVDKTILLAGYVRYSPTVVSYTVGEEKFEVIPGFFKDRSDVIDLRANKNGTFNVLTLEKGYQGHFLRLRTHGKDGTILFERQVDIGADYRVLSGRTTDFIDGNIAITGTYGGRNSYYSQGVYFAVAKPEGQDNLLSFIDFTEMEHFFDYMRPKRAERIKRKIKRKREAGKDYKYNSRLLLNEVDKSDDGFLISAEVYDPRYERRSSPGFQNSYFNYPYQDFYSGANYSYVRQPNRLVNVEQANHFEFLESIVLKVDKQGKLKWDGSFKVDDVESASLTPVVDHTKKDENLYMLYKNEEQISYKLFIQQDSSTQAEQPIKLEFEEDEIKHNYDLIGGTEYWYGDNFFVWGYHKVENKVNPAIDKRRAVLFINKVRFE